MTNKSGTLENSLNKYLWDICCVWQMLNARSKIENDSLKKKKNGPKFLDLYFLNAQTYITNGRLGLMGVTWK